MKITAEELRDLLTPGTWFQLPRAFLTVMKMSHAGLLAHLLNRSTIAETDEQGWFSCSEEHLLEHVYFTKDQQQTGLKVLSDLGLIEVKNASWYHKRMIRLRMVAIFEVLREGHRCKESRRQLKLTDRSKKGCPTDARKVDVSNREDSVIEDSSENTRGGFFGADELSFCEKAAIYLETVIRENRKLQAPPAKRKWVQELEKLLKEINDQSRIKRTLQWLRKHYSDQYTPRVFSAQQFRLKFLQLEEAMERSSSKVETPAVLVQPSPDQQELVDNVQRLPWPAQCSRAALTAAVVRSDVEYRAWRKKCKEAYERWTAIDRDGWSPPPYQSFHPHLFHMLGSEFLDNWWLRMCKSVRHWTEWSGKAENLAWRPDHKDFVTMAEGIAHGYGNDAALWTEYITRINEG